MEGHRPPPRLHRRHAHLPGRHPHRLLRLYGPCTRRRRQRLRARRRRHLRGGAPGPDHEVHRTRRGQPGPREHRPPQRPRIEPGRRRPLFARRLQRDRHETARHHARRVRHRRPRGNRRLRLRPHPNRHTRCAATTTDGHLHEFHAGRRLQRNRHARRHAPRLRPGCPCRLHGHLAHLPLRHQRAARLRPGLPDLRHARCPRPGNAQQPRLTRAVHRQCPRGLHPQRPASRPRVGPTRHRPLRHRPLPRRHCRGTPRHRPSRGIRRTVELPRERPCIGDGQRPPPGRDPHVQQWWNGSPPHARRAQRHRLPKRSPDHVRRGH